MKTPLSKDIVIVILLTIASIVCIIALPLTKYPINLISYILLALFLPGYAIMATLYPLKENTGPYTRILGSILFSLFITIILVLLDLYNIIHVSVLNIFFILGILTIIMSAASIYRKYRLNKNSEEKNVEEKGINNRMRFSDTITKDMESSKDNRDKNVKNENLTIYKTRRYSIKDLYVVIFLTLLALAVLVFPVNKYLANPIITPLNMVLSFLIIFLSGFAFWAAVFPIRKIGRSKRLLMTLIFGILLLTAFYYLLKLNPLNGPNIILLLISSVVISLMCIIACLRRMKIPKMKKDVSKYKNGKEQEKFSFIEYEIPVAKNEKYETPVKEFNKSEQPHPVNNTDKILIDEPEGQKNHKPRFVSFDLLLVFLTTVICVAFILTPKLNGTILITIIGILLILFLPGYSLVAALYPKKDDLEGYERASLSFGFPLIGLAFGIVVNNITQLTMNLTFILILLSAFTIIMVLIAYIRRRRTTEIEKMPVDYSELEASNEPSSKIESKPHSEIPEMVKEEIVSEKISKRSFVSKDLFLIFLTTLLAIVFIVTPKLNDTFIRTILGLFLILFIPGYSLIAALFPKKDDLDGIERAALSFGLSIAVTPLIGLALNYTPYGIRLTPILISLSAFTVIMVIIAYIRRRRVPEGEKFYVNFGGFFSSIKGMFKGESKTSKILSIILIISILLAIGTTAYIIIKPKQGESFTEFYLLGPGGKASDYPTNLTAGQNASVIIGIVNHEYKTVDYNLVVTSNGAVMSNMNITVAEGNKTEIPYTFSSGTAGNKTIEFLLYKLPDNTNIYRSLHLNVKVV